MRRFCARGASTPHAVVLTTFPDRYRLYWADGMRAKLGLSKDTPGDETLFDDLLALLHTHRVDYTTSFRRLQPSCAVTTSTGVRCWTIASRSTSGLNAGKPASTLRVVTRSRWRLQWTV